MKNALEIMWISCFWFLMPGLSVTTRSGGSAGGAKSPSGSNEPAREPHTTRPGTALTPSAAITPEPSGRSGDGACGRGKPPEERRF